MPKNNLFDVVVQLKMQNWQNIEALWSFVGVQHTLNAAWWATTIHNVLKINLYAQGAFFSFKILLLLYNWYFEDIFSYY